MTIPSKSLSEESTQKRSLFSSLHQTPKIQQQSNEKPKLLLIRRSSSSRSVRHETHFNPYDLRFFIIRHGERVDRYFGPDWYKKAFDHVGRYERFHKNLPLSVPNRPNLSYWAQDTPLTYQGSQAAQILGQKFAVQGVNIHYVYSSPAVRCVSTTFEILKGLGLEKKLSICIEPGLLELGAARFGMHLFLKPIDWIRYGVNIDLAYQPFIEEIPADEREAAYYIRSKRVMRHLEERHRNPSSSCINVLIVGHATSTETLTWDLLRKHPNVKNLFNVSLRVSYLQTAIVERKRRNQEWFVRRFY